MVTAAWIVRLSSAAQQAAVADLRRQLEAAGIVALHAAALRPDLFASVTLRGCPESWESIVRDPRPAGLLDTTVHGVLETYDLPDLVPLAGTDRVSRR